MVSERTFVDASRALLFLLLYAALASALEPRFAPYVRVVVALFASAAVFAAVDVLPALVRGERPLVDVDSRLYSVRGLIALISIVLVTAVTVDWLRGSTSLSGPVVTLAGVVVGITVVLGPIAGYYWRRSANRPAT